MEYVISNNFLQMFQQFWLLLDLQEKDSRFGYQKSQICILHTRSNNIVPQVHSCLPI